MNEIERHIQQTTDRLQCIKQHLLGASSFRTAARELLEWCLDERAFQPHFEAGLISCLTVVSKVAPQVGYDFDLGYRLLAVCAAHKDRFSPNSAGLLSSWSEELGQLLLQRQQARQQTLNDNTKAENPTSLENPAAEKPMQMGPEGTPGQSLESQTDLNTWAAASSQMSSSPLDSVSWDTVPDGNMMPFDQGPPCFPAGSPSFAGKPQQPLPQQPLPQQPLPQQPLPQQPLPQQPQAQQPQPPHQVAQQQQQQQQHAFPKSPYNASVAPGFSGQTPPNGFSQLNGYPPTPTTPGSSKSVYESSPLTESLTAVMSPASSAATTAMMSPKMWPRQENVRMNGAMFNGCRPQMYPGVEMFDDPFYNHHYTSYDGPSSASSSSSAYPQQPTMRRMSGQPPGYGYNHGMMALHSNMTRSPKDYGGPMPLRAATGGVGVGGGVYSGRQHVAPYPCNPQQYMRSKRAQCPVGQQMMYGPFREQMGQPCYGPRLGPVQGQPHMAPGVNYLPSQAVRPGDPYGCNPISYSAYPPSNGSLYPGPADMKNSPQPYYMCSPHSQMPGNPTPPVTPGSTMPAYMSPGGADVKPNMADLKPMLMTSSMVNSGELRLTFPVHDGILMAPFRLEHNLAVSNHVFHLNESVYQALMSRSDLELHLKCFHHEDCQMTTNWPASVMVSVNANPMNIEIQRPLNVKDVCHLGRNTIQITVTACCCSHMFIVHLVHRPTVRSVICGLLEKNLLSAEDCLAKLKPFLSQSTSIPSGTNNNNNNNATNATSSSSSSSSSVTQQQQQQQTMSGTKLSLKCPITLQRVCLPTRGQHCSHLQWFDLEAYLRLNSERCVWKCPICKKPATLEELEVNQLLWAIAENLRATDFDEILVDTLGTWRPLPTVMQITTDNNNETSGSKFVRGTTVSSMTLPTVETWMENYSSRVSAASAAAAVASSSASSAAALPAPHAGNAKDPWNNTSVPNGTSDILTSLAQMGESLVDSRIQPSSSLSSSHRIPTSSSMDSMAMGRPTTSTSTVPEKVPSASTNCGANPVFTSATSASSESHDCHHLQMKSKDVATTSVPADVSVGNVGDDGRNTDTHLKETSCSSTSSSSSGSSGSSSSSSSSNVDINFKLTPNCDSEQQDSGLDLLTDGFEDPTELLTYLGPGNNSDFGMGSDDLLSLFLPD